MFKHVEPLSNHDAPQPVCCRSRSNVVGFISLSVNLSSHLRLFLLMGMLKLASLLTDITHVSCLLIK